MKKIVAIWITVFLLTGLATSAFAFGPGWGGHERYDHHQGYAHGWQDNGRGHGRGAHDRDNRQERRVYDQHNGSYASSYGAGANVALPLVPLPGFSLWLPGISISIH
jgi:hypothetical protein